MFACCSAGDRPDLALEPFGAQPLRQIRREHLHDDLALESQLLGDEDAAHAAAAELALQAVGVAEGFLELGPQLGAQSRTKSSCGREESFAENYGGGSERGLES